MHIDLSFLSSEDIQDMERYLLYQIDLIPDHVPTISVSEYAEQKRVLPPGTPYPGPWSNSRTPYLVEIMDCMGVTSSIQHLSVLKGAQLGFTAAMENIVVYWIDAVPAPIMFTSANETKVKEWAETRLEPAIDSCGARRKIIAAGKASSSRRQGDRTMRKEFLGGFINLASAQSAPSLRSDSIRVLMRDEIDGSPEFLRTGEGAWLDVSYARTFAWGFRKKIMDVSTPTTFNSSAVYKQYLLGDERKFMVACPHCGGYQFLDWGSPKLSHGMRGETKAGKLCDVYYQCEHCHDAIFDRHKKQLLDSGYWKPTAEPSSPHVRSYYLPSLYSPNGMLTWWTMWEKWVEAKNNPEKMRAFTNLFLGLPYRESGERPKLENVIELRSSYRRGVVPSDDVLFLTLAVDVQRGSKTKESNPARLEIEVCGHGAGFKTWSIDHTVIEGEIDDAFSGAWAIFRARLTSRGFGYERSDGEIFYPQLILIDSGDGPHTNTVYEFCRGLMNTYPTKGTAQLKRKTRAGKDDGDTVDNLHTVRYRPKSVAADLTLYTISTNFYKHHVYNHINNTYRHLDDKEGRNAICEFPLDYSDEYFAQLTAEERRGDGSFHCPDGRRNEALDLRVLNLCACDIYLDKLVWDMKADAKMRKLHQKEIDKINHQLVLAKMKRSPKIRKSLDHV